MLDRALRRLKQERGVPLRTSARKLAKLLTSWAVAPWRLRACSRLGSRVRADGVPRIVNRGFIAVGDGATVSSELGAVELETGPGGRIEIGERAFVNYGARVYAARQVIIGANAGISPHCTISDVDPSAPDAEPRPVVIERDAWIATGVTVLPGARIGAGATIVAGSVVSGEIPAGSVAGGVPARILRFADDSSGAGGAR
jgi:acetyltransferase-like isoleucine patch superfamily enzyme